MGLKLLHHSYLGFAIGNQEVLSANAEPFIQQYLCIFFLSSAVSDDLKKAILVSLFFQIDNYILLIEKRNQVFPIPEKEPDSPAGEDIGLYGEQHSPERIYFQYFKSLDLNILIDNILQDELPEIGLFILAGDKNLFFIGKGSYPVP